MFEVKNINVERRGMIKFSHFHGLDLLTLVFWPHSVNVNDLGFFLLKTGFPLKVLSFKLLWNVVLRQFSTELQFVFMHAIDIIK